MEDNNQIVTLDDFITSKLNLIRKNALEASRNKTNTTLIDIEKVYGKKYVKEVLQSYVKDAQERLDALKKQESERIKRFSDKTPEFISPNVNRPMNTYRLSEAEESLEQAKKMLSGEISYTPQQLSNCIANLSEFFPHGLPYGNQTFKANPGKYGFKKIATKEVQPGDIVQHVVYPYNKAVHALLYNGKDGTGTPTFNYSDGTHSGWKTYRNYPELTSKDGNLDYHADVYRYVGTPQDSLQWTNEWLEMQQNANKKLSSGGSINYLKFFNK